jgi:micrococcal nuclease
VGLFSFSSSAGRNRRDFIAGGRWGSALLLVAAAVILVRPWEDGPAPGMPAAPAVLHGRVLRAVDGDTLEVRLRDAAVETVRLIGVDTPETVKPDTPVQCFGPRASAFEHRVVEGRRVRLLTGVERRDVYGRLLAYVWLLPGRAAGAGDVSNAGSSATSRQVSHNGRRDAQREFFLNAVLVRRGLARTLEIPPNIRFAERFARILRVSARAGRGLWGRCRV